MSLPSVVLCLLRLPAFDLPSQLPFALPSLSRTPLLPKETFLRPCCRPYYSGRSLSLELLISLSPCSFASTDLFSELLAIRIQLTSDSMRRATLLVTLMASCMDCLRADSSDLRRRGRSGRRLDSTRALLVLLSGKLGTGREGRTQSE